MKKLPLLAVCILTLFSCQKSSLSTPPLIEYKVNGSLVQITGGRDTSSQRSIINMPFGSFIFKPYGSGYYNISGFEKTYGISISIPTGHDSLLAKTYTGYLGINILANGGLYGIGDIHDSIIVTITRYSHGSVDGTFSGGFSDTSRNRISVTEGKLNNLKVYF
jgi:hypothetical protein